MIFKCDISAHLQSWLLQQNSYYGEQEISKIFPYLAFAKALIYHLTICSAFVWVLYIGKHFLKCEFRYEELAYKAKSLLFKIYFSYTI